MSESWHHQAASCPPSQAYWPARIGKGIPDGRCPLHTGHTCRTSCSPLNLHHRRLHTSHSGLKCPLHCAAKQTCALRPQGPREGKTQECKNFVGGFCVVTLLCSVYSCACSVVFLRVRFAYASACHGDLHCHTRRKAATVMLQTWYDTKRVQYCKASHKVRTQGATQRKRNAVTSLRHQ